MVRINRFRFNPMRVRINSSPNKLVNLSPEIQVEVDHLRRQSKNMLGFDIDATDEEIAISKRLIPEEQINDRPSFKEM